ncbi:MAG: alpha/beta hydrolase [Rhodospirillales bacterium]|nr:alpha/beta hydrolase [Rhodospirillales bacterium]
MIENPSQPTSHTYTSQRLRLHYLDWGNEDAPPLLLVHGGRDHARSWDWMARELSEDYHIIAVDQRGHGDSQWNAAGNYVSDEFICDMAKLVDTAGLAPVRILSHSMGSIVSLRYAGIFPQNVVKVMAIEGFGGRPSRRRASEDAPLHDRYRQWIERMRDFAERPLRRYPDMEEAIARMAEANAHLSAEQARHLTIHGVNRNEDGSFSWKFDPCFYGRFLVPSGLNPPDGPDLWRQIICPVLLVRGADSWALGPEESGAADNFKNVRCEIIQDAGHWVHHDQLDQVLELARGFLVG